MQKYKYNKITVEMLQDLILEWYWRSKFGYLIVDYAYNYPRRFTIQITNEENPKYYTYIFPTQESHIEFLKDLDNSIIKEAERQFESINRS